MQIHQKPGAPSDITRTYFEHSIWSDRPNSPVPDMPLDVQLELINRCNLACDACAILSQTRDRSLLTWATLESVVHEAAAEGVCYFTICGIGEAALHPDLFRLLRLIRDQRVAPRGMRVLEMMPSVLISNMMWSQQTVTRCLQDPPDLISVSLAGLTDAEIEDRRRPIDVQRVWNNIERVYRERSLVRDVDGALTPTIHVSTHIYPHEFEERRSDIDAFMQRWSAISDAIVLKPTMLGKSVQNLDAFVSDDASAVAVTPRPSANLQYTDISSTHYTRTAPCMETSRRLSVNSDGSVWCGHHNSEDFGDYLGNAAQQSLREIWHGDAMNKFRREVRAGVFHRSGCQSCGGEIRDVHRSAETDVEGAIRFTSQ